MIRPWNTIQKWRQKKMTIKTWKSVLHKIERVTNFHICPKRFGEISLLLSTSLPQQHQHLLEKIPMRIKTPSGASNKGAWLWKCLIPSGNLQQEHHPQELPSCCNFFRHILFVAIFWLHTFLLLLKFWAFLFKSFQFSILNSATQFKVNKKKSSQFAHHYLWQIFLSFYCFSLFLSVFLKYNILESLY